MAQNLQSKINELELRIKQLEEEKRLLKAAGNGNQKITQKNILDKLKESEDRYILTQNLAKTGSWEIKPGTYKIWASDNMLSILGIEKESSLIELNHILEVVHNDDKLTIETAYIDIIEKNKSFDLVIKTIKTNKDERDLRYIQFIGIVIKNENDSLKNIVGVVKDITDFNKTIKELKRSKDRAEESDRLKTSFLSNMSHDLRTPMNAIIGYSELLNLSNTNPQNRREFSKIIKQKGLQLLTLIDDIIEVSKFETGIQNISRNEFNLHVLLNEVRNIFLDKRVDLGKENININLVLPPNNDDLTVYTDSGRLQQVLGNLINNGLKFTEKGYVEFGYELFEDKIKFYVKDTGKGVPKDKQKYIFNRFKSIEKTTRLKYTGSGLGLTLSKRIVDLLGGKIWIESEENKGAAFFFTIPLTSPGDEEITEVINDNKEITNQNWKNKVILIVEDEEINYKFLETVLHDTQAQILYAKDGMQAIDLCLSINKIDLILMDIKMPEMDGYEATKRIKQIRPEIPIIAQTAFASRDDKMTSLKAGCDDYVAKPIEIELLISKINKFFVEKDY